jgi:diaminohydroxyphosphoribosylaminopyrimidine deaminase / 5-amino-6-(5-phosphoribosylamino)uracil reductase
MYELDLYIAQSHTANLIHLFLQKMDNGVHINYMLRCLHLAALGGSHVAPNPMVGAVLVREEKIIGEAYHKQFGEAHAEVHCIQEALKIAPEKISDSTLYVSLEPCAHYGKTPPCADLIIAHKIPKVVIACRDSFEEVNGKGVEKLKAAGIEVIEDVLKDEAVSLNKRFFTFHEKKRPYVLLKWAQTADGYIASGDDNRLLISNDVTNRLVHKWRSKEAAIMIGANTAILDTPLLNNRHWMGNPPVKIIIDPHLKVPITLKLFQSQTNVIVLNVLKEGLEGRVNYVKIEAAQFIADAVKKLFEMKVQSVLVEGGQKLLQSFIDTGLWDEAMIITNTKLPMHNGLCAPVLRHEIFVKEENIFDDKIVYFKNRDNKFC